MSEGSLHAAVVCRMICAMRITDERITNLEIKSSFQEELIETLNQCVIELRNDLEGMQTIVSQLQKQMAQGDLAVGPADDPPPHY